MGKTQWQQLEATVVSIQKRWGTGALEKGLRNKKSHAYSVVPIGQPQLDTALEIGGLPQGHISELIGRGSAGHFTLALSVLRQAQRCKRQVTYIDMSCSIDLDHVAQCGVDFDSLVILRPIGAQQAFKMIRELAGVGMGVIVLDRTNDLLVEFDSDYRLITYLRNLRSLVHQTRCTLLFLTDFTGPEYPDPILPNYTSVRILCEHQGWRREGKRVTGYTSRITILKNKFGRPGQSLSISFPVRRDSES